MLVQDKLQETNEADTTDSPAVELRAPTASEPSGVTRAARRPWRWVSALAATGAVVGIATIAVVTPPSGGDSGSVSDDSSAVVEANRVEVLRDLATGRVPDDSSAVVEANRVEVLRDLATGRVPDDSSAVVEANRVEVLRDLATTP